MCVLLCSSGWLWPKAISHDVHRRRYFLRAQYLFARQLHRSPMRDSRALNVTPQAAIGVMRKSTQSGSVLIQATRHPHDLSLCQSWWATQVRPHVDLNIRHACSMQCSHAATDMSEPQGCAPVCNTQFEALSEGFLSGSS
jgi:hypothetical protein